MAKRKLVIVGNWKMNKTPQEAKKFLVEFKKLYETNKHIFPEGISWGFGAPYIDLHILTENKIAQNMIIAAQNMNENQSGAFTGEISATMLKAISVNSVIIGHSERRAMYNETDQSVNKKLHVALKNNLLPIVCIGETLVERKANTWKELISKQIKLALKDISSDDAKKIVIAYEPIWAIGTGITASPDQAQEACAYVRDRVAIELTPMTAENIIIQYGGSVKPDNVSKLMSQQDIDGALVGGASIDAKTFMSILTLNN